MAMPILLTLYVVEKNTDVHFNVLLEHDAIVPSSVLFEIEFNVQEPHPWGVTPQKMTSAPTAFFAHLPDNFIQSFSDALSAFLNSAHGWENNNPQPLLLNEVESIHGHVFTYALHNNKEDILLIPVCKEGELRETLATLPFFEGAASFQPRTILDNTKSFTKKMH